MAKKAETKFKERVLGDIRSLENSWAVKVQQVGIRGTPDILASIGGFFFGIELKADVDSPIAPLQQYELTKIEESGGFGLVVHPSIWKDVFLILVEFSLRQRKGAGHSLYREKLGRLSEKQ